MKTITKNISRKNLYILFFTFFIFNSCSSSKWHTFQGNNSRTGFVERPEIRNPKIKWKTYIGIQGYLNNSIINSNSIYVGSSGYKHNTPDSLDGIYSIKKSTGLINWHFKTLSDACGIAFSKNKIYVTSDDGQFRCLNASNGKELWSIQREGELYSQPLIIKNLVIIGDATGTIIIVDKDSGRIFKEEKISDSNIRGGLSSDGKYIFATFEEGVIACLDKNGNLLWKVKGEFNGEDFSSIYAAPTISGNNLIIPFVRSTYYRTPALYSYNKVNGELIWKATNNSSEICGNIRSSVAIRNDFIYYGDTYSDKLCIISLENGKMIKRYKMGEPTFPHWSSPIISNNMLYLGRFDGSFNAFDIKNKKLVWQLFLGDHENINRPKNKHTNRWNSKNGSIYATPSIDVDGTIYIGNGEGWLYSIVNKEIDDSK